MSRVPGPSNDSCLILILEIIAAVAFLMWTISVTSDMSTMEEKIERLEKVIECGVTRGPLEHVQFDDYLADPYTCVVRNPEEEFRE